MKANFLFFIATTLLISCGQNDKAAAGKKESTSETSSSGNNTITFKVNGDQVNSEGWIVQRFVWDDETPHTWITIVSNMHKDKRTITVNLAGGAPGIYNFPPFSYFNITGSHGSYFPDYSKPLESYQFTKGEFHIIVLDTLKGILSGTFSGIVKNVNGKELTISDGKLTNVKLKAGVANLDKEMNKINQ